MDFVHDQLALGNKLRVLTAVDIFSKFSPVIDPRFSYRAEDVVMTLERVCSEICAASRRSRPIASLRMASTPCTVPEVARDAVALRLVA